MVICMPLNFVTRELEHVPLLFPREAGDINVVYKRNHGGVGLIEPENSERGDSLA